ncbi:hypothetical protein NIES4073_62310 [Kalymmatonema gypsitolerans NIES-4073]|nr:hypothetical protein NIES4073_62310 [Scytonema sp. NIES-4073]
MLKGACIVARQFIDVVLKRYDLRQYSKMDITAKSPQSVQLPHAHDGLTV